MVVQDSDAAKKTFGFAEIDDGPVGKELGYRIGRFGSKWCCLLLRRLWGFAK